MAFYDSSGSERGSRPTWQQIFVRLTADHPTVIQILEPEVAEKHIVWKHYIPQARRKSGSRGIPIACPGFSVCPICKRNSELPDRDHPDYISASRKYVINVLDLTPRKLCSLCQTENYTNKCSYCDSDLKDTKLEEPEVRLLEAGVQLCEQLATLEQSITDPEGKPLGIAHFPIKLVSSGTRGTPPVPIALPPNDRKVEDYKDKFISLDGAYVKLNATEIMELINGGSLSDVLKARSSSEETKSSGAPFSDEELTSAF